MLLLQLYHLGFEVGRFISLERLVEENKQRYYETLEQSSVDWHDGRHDFWSYENFVLSILSTAYRQLEERVGHMRSPRGVKTEQVLDAIKRSPGPFRVAELQEKCPGVSPDSIRKTLKALRLQGRVVCLGRGQHAQWQKTDHWELGTDESIG